MVKVHRTGVPFGSSAGESSPENSAGSLWPESRPGILPGVPFLKFPPRHLQGGVSITLGDGNPFPVFTLVEHCRPRSWWPVARIDKCTEIVYDNRHALRPLRPCQHHRSELRDATEGTAGIHFPA